MPSSLMRPVGSESGVAQGKPDKGGEGSELQGPVVELERNTSHLELGTFFGSW